MYCVVLNMLTVFLTDILRTHTHTNLKRLRISGEISSATGKKVIVHSTLSRKW